ncbi:MAG: hypothetical protein WC740_17345 [Verrucomicrobiia bacterium]
MNSLEHVRAALEFVVDEKAARAAVPGLRLYAKPFREDSWTNMLFITANHHDL